MKESLKLKYTPILLNASHLQLKPLQLNIWREIKILIERVAHYLPAESIMLFIGIKVISNHYIASYSWLPYLGLCIFILMRHSSSSFKSEEQSFDADHSMMAISVLAYAIWNAAVGVFFFLCTLLLITIG